MTEPASVSSPLPATVTPARAVRVLHVISNIDPRSGGPAAAVVGLVSAQKRAGLDVSLLSAWADGADLSPAEVLRRQGVTVDLVGPVRGTLGSHPELSNRVRNAVAGADVLHIHALWEQSQHIAAAAARRAGVPYVFRPCGMLDPWSLRQSRWKKRLYMACRLRHDLNGSAAIHYTAELEASLAAPLGLTPPPIVEPNGVDLMEFHAPPRPGSFRARYPVIGNRPLVLFLSRLHPKKGIELLLRAFAGGAPAEAVLAVVGPGEPEYRHRLEDMARELGFADRVVFTGMLKGADRVAALADADLFALPSYQENFGIAVVEALAAGTPVVISDQVNIHRELAAAGVAGVVPLEVEALGRELRRWLTDAAMRRTARERCRPFVRSRYDWEAIARRWAGHYLWMVSARVL